MGPDVGVGVSVGREGCQHLAAKRAVFWGEVLGTQQHSKQRKEIEQMLVWDLSYRQQGAPYRACDAVLVFIRK